MAGDPIRLTIEATSLPGRSCGPYVDVEVGVQVRKEVDATGQRGVGDPDGRGSFTAIVDGDQLCFGITVKNIDKPVAAHIHKAKPSLAGPVVVPLTQPSSGDPGASSGCVTVDAAVARAILKHPRRYYANVHTMAFPGGAVRGQLFRKSN